MWWSLLILSVAGFWLQASGGIAPGDESTLCVEDPRFETNYPNNQRVLLDSYNYHNLLQHTVPGSPWTVLNADTFGNGVSLYHLSKKYYIDFYFFAVGSGTE